MTNHLIPRGGFRRTMRIYHAKGAIDHCSGRALDPNRVAYMVVR